MVAVAEAAEAAAETAAAQFISSQSFAKKLRTLPTSKQTKRKEEERRKKCKFELRKIGYLISI